MGCSPAASPRRHFAILLKRFTAWSGKEMHRSNRPRRGCCTGPCIGGIAPRERDRRTHRTRPRRRGRIGHIPRSPGSGQRRLWVPRESSRAADPGSCPVCSWAGVDQPDTARGIGMTPSKYNPTTKRLATTKSFPHRPRKHAFPRASIARSAAERDGVVLTGRETSAPPGPSCVVQGCGECGLFPWLWPQDLA